MEDNRLPNQVRYSELPNASRPIPKLRFRDVLKRDLNAYGIADTSWEKNSPTAKETGNLSLKQENKHSWWIVSAAVFIVAHDGKGHDDDCFRQSVEEHSVARSVVRATQEQRCFCHTYPKRPTSPNRICQVRIENRSPACLLLKDERQEMQLFDWTSFLLTCSMELGNLVICSFAADRRDYGQSYKI